ncbi:hypothetical protein N8T08_006150 [Aspergillus melleus]|uniref:Uncharacterized protein n=1 Tax=Aspergillus melleus TaxID=138277 RepID=A0ACC3B101_9EURO|nr:hypothetical protein N8T08_006150 [Aspergillus melleus]
MAPNALLELLSSLRADGAYSDVTIKCESVTFKVHSCIICPQSAFFEKALSGRFKEAISKEIVIQDDPSIIGRIIDYLYRGDYDDSPHFVVDPQHSLPFPGLEPAIKSQSETGPIKPDPSIQSRPTTPSRAFSVTTLNLSAAKAHANIRMYNAADKYAINGLMILSKKKSQSIFTDDLEDSSFIQAIEYVYGPESPPHSELRDTIATFAVRHYSTLKGLDQFHEAREKFLDFSFDFSTAMMERMDELETGMK